jgi:ABC-type nickel/cobalt efflux system permease component RcnA
LEVLSFVFCLLPCVFCLLSFVCVFCLLCVNVDVVLSLFCLLSFVFWLLSSFVVFCRLLERVCEKEHTQYTDHTHKERERKTKVTERNAREHKDMCGRKGKTSTFVRRIRKTQRDLAREHTMSLFSSHFRGGGALLQPFSDILSNKLTFPSSHTPSRQPHGSNHSCVCVCWRDTERECLVIWKRFFDCFETLCMVSLRGFNKPKAFTQHFHITPLSLSRIQTTKSHTHNTHPIQRA